MLRIPHCLDSRLTDGGKVGSLTHLPHFTPFSECKGKKPNTTIASATAHHRPAHHSEEQSGNFVWGLTRVYGSILVCEMVLRDTTLWPWDENWLLYGRCLGSKPAQLRWKLCLVPLFMYVINIYVRSSRVSLRLRASFQFTFPALKQKVQRINDLLLSSATTGNAQKTTSLTILRCRGNVLTELDVEWQKNTHTDLEPLLFLSSSSSIVNGPLSRPTTSQKIW
jgi:hypothetical protein